MQSEIITLLESVTLATQSQRYKAAWVDGSLGVAAFLTGLPLLHQLTSRLGRPEFTLIFVVAFVLSFETAQVALWGRTIGHRMFGLKVVDEFGRNPGFSQAMQRWLLKTLYGLRTFDSMGYDGRRTAAHDKATRTYVIHVG